MTNGRTIVKLCVKFLSISAIMNTKVWSCPAGGTSVLIVQVLFWMVQALGCCCVLAFLIWVIILKVVLHLHLHLVAVSAWTNA